MRKMLSVVLVGLLGLSMFSILAPKVKADSVEKTLFSDNFEGYTVGTFPSPPWQWWFDGAGSAYNKIVNSVANSGNQSLTMLGYDDWASVAAVNISNIGNIINSGHSIGYEVWVRVDNNVQSYLGARVGFDFIRYGSIWASFCSVDFNVNGNITSGSANIEPFSINTWYKIRVVFDPNTRQYSVWINDVLKAANIVDTTPEDPKTTLHCFGLASDHGDQQSYFDDVRVFEIVPGPVVPEFWLGSITGIAACFAAFALFYVLRKTPRRWVPKAPKATL
jgi:hypothetical protein